nr:hypothetical protein [Candidatus Dependentiae bacterium]
MNKNNCDFFKEQIMLKFYGEPYENSILTHIENCPGCKKFEKELTEKFEFNSPENKFDSIKKEITLNQNVFFKFFNSNFIKYSAAVIIILFLPVILVLNSGKKNIE